MENNNKLYEEWKELKGKLISFSRYCMDDSPVTDELYEMHLAHRKRIKEIEDLIYPQVFELKKF
jgi:hypothetical protein